MDGLFLMDKIKVGFLTIGQSPREDLIPEIKPLILPHIEIVEHGLLDNLSPEEIKLLRPEMKETPLVTRLRDGSQVQLSERKISELLPKAIDLMKTRMDVKAVGILCTHDFPKTKFPCLAIFPFDYLQFLINHILEIGSLGVVVPLENQVEMAKKKWKKEKTVVVTKSPYTEGKIWDEIAKIFAQEKVEAVILDCIGYKINDRKEIQSLIHVPTLLPRAILAFAINQLF